MVAQVVLNVREQLAAECIFARLIRQSEMTHLVQRRLREELDHVHAGHYGLFLLDVARDILKIRVGHDRFLNLGRRGCRQCS